MPSKVGIHGAGKGWGTHAVASAYAAAASVVARVSTAVAGPLPNVATQSSHLGGSSMRHAKRLHWVFAWQETLAEQPP